MPGRTPSTSSAGMPAACGGVWTLAGQFTSPRDSAATCKAVASPVGCVALAWPMCIALLPGEPEPQAARTPAMAITRSGLMVGMVFSDVATAMTDEWNEAALHLLFGDEDLTATYTHPFLVPVRSRSTVLRPCTDCFHEKPAEPQCQQQEQGEDSLDHCFDEAHVVPHEMDQRVDHNGPEQAEPTGEEPHHHRWLRWRGAMAGKIGLVSHVVAAVVV